MDVGSWRCMAGDVICERFFRHAIRFAGFVGRKSVAPSAVVTHPERNHRFTILNSANQGSSYITLAFGRRRCAFLPYGLGSDLILCFPLIRMSRL